MKKLAILALVFAACGGGGDMKKMKSIKDKMCACTDQKCMDGVESEMKDLEKTLRDKYPKKEDAPKDLLEVADDIKKCRRDLRNKLEGSAGGGSPDMPPAPPAGGAAPAPGGSAAPTP